MYVRKKYHHRFGHSMEFIYLALFLAAGVLHNIDLGR